MSLDLKGFLHFEPGISVIMSFDVYTFAFFLDIFSMVISNTATFSAVPMLRSDQCSDPSFS